MPAEWFYLKGDKKCGPFGTAEIKRLAAEGQLSKEDLVWKTGATGSIRASRVKGLFPDEATETLPLPGSPEPAGKDEDVHEVKTAAFALFIALSKRIMGTTSRVLESASKYSGKLEADLREVQKNERKDPPAGVAANPKPLTNRTVARGSEGIEQASKKRIGAKRLMMLGGGGVGLALCVYGLLGVMPQFTGSDELNASTAAPRSTSATPRRMSKSEFRERLSQLPSHPDALMENSFDRFPETELNRIVAELKDADIYSSVGKPHRTQTMGGHKFMYWVCSDGDVQLVCKLSFCNDKTGLLGVCGINDY